MFSLNDQGLCIVISGPAGAGKSTIREQLLKNNPNLWRSISMTTREIRGKEIDGVDYYFVSRNQFEDAIAKNELLEYAIVHNNDYYGTPKKAVMDKMDNKIDIILEIDINGAAQIKDIFKQAIFIFILPPNMEELQKRLINRHTESEEKVIARFNRAYQEITEATHYDYIIINDEVEKSVAKIEAIIKAEKCRVDRLQSFTDEIAHIKRYN